MVVIEIPKSTLDFEIGGKKYVLDMSDKTINQLNFKVNQIQMNEIKAEQAVQEKIAAYDDELQNLRSKNTLKGLNQVDYKHEEHKLQNKFDRMVVNASKKSFKEMTHAYIDFLDYIFEKNAGQDIYQMCNESTVVLGKIVTQISVAINNDQDLVDYRMQYVNKIRALKNGDNQIEQEPNQIQK